MKIQQQVFGTTAWNNAYTGPLGQLTVDMDRKSIRLHDGITPGGAEIQNIGQVANANSRRFTAVRAVNMAAPTNLVTADVGKLLQLTAVGAPRVATLPPLADFDVGQPVLCMAMSPDVSIAGHVGEGLIYAGADNAALLVALTQYSIYTFVKLSPTRFILTDKF